MTSMSVSADQQRLLPDNVVELFDFDATSIDGTTFYRWTSAFRESGTITWKGNTYTPLPISASGFEVSAKGALPTPILRISNVLLLPGAIIASLGDPLGAKVTRWKTFRHYLDDGDYADANAFLPKEVWQVERKKSENRVFVEFELSAYLDKEGRQLPGRQVLRDACTQIYRNYDGSSFDYSKVTCPYTGSDYFNASGDSVSDPSEDVCGKHKSDCALRFGSSPLPGWFFPGVGRVR